MPSTMSTVVSVPLASSTVITPSFFTFFMASAMRRPIASSLLADTRATSSIFLKSSPTSSDIALMFSTTTATALSMPRLRSMGLAPAATFLRPTLIMACARTVAVVVPSPASSPVLEATSFTSCAPMFWNGSSSSTSRATLTPSLVMWGAPNFFSMITWRPLGPRVTFTASARASTPFLSSSRAFISNFISFAIMLFCFQMKVIGK